MNIKPIIIALVLFCGASFSAHSQLYSVYQVNWENGCAAVGDIVDLDAVASCLDGFVNPVGWTFFNTRASYGGSASTAGGDVRYSDGSTGGYFAVVSASRTSTECTPPKQIDPATGVCKELPPEPCPPGYERNELGVCVPVEPQAFCENEFLDLDAKEYLACSDQNKDNFFEYTSYCNSKDDYGFNCKVGIPKPVDPTDPITPPSGDFGGGSSGTATPDLPDFDKPEPDSPTPDSNTDTAVMEAIRNLNRDNNAALKGINTDVNKGFTDINNQLTQLNGTNKALGQSVLDQMKQDYQIYQGTKQLALQQTNTIATGNNAIKGAITSQTGVLKTSIDGLGSNIDELGTKLDRIHEAIGDNAPCDPNVDERGCEGKSGMTTKLASDVATQINSVVGSGFDDAEKEVTDAVKGFIDDSKLGPVEGHMYEAVNIAMSALPSAGDCVAFSMPSLFGDRVDFGCDFSVKFKAVASFLMYIYTIWTLIDILLNGVTPAAGTVPHRSRGI